MKQSRHAAVHDINADLKFVTYDVIAAGDGDYRQLPRMEQSVCCPLTRPKRGKVAARAQPEAVRKYGPRAVRLQEASSRGLEYAMCVQCMPFM